jgi:hypothetical protein
VARILSQRVFIEASVSSLDRAVWALHGRLVLGAVFVRQ